MEDTLLYKEITIKSLYGKYNVEFNNSKINFFNKDSVFFIDHNIFNIYKKNFFNKKRIYLVKANEKEKSFENIIKPLNFFIKNNINKKDKIICIGGGITQDICSFVCSVYFRGLEWYFYPTTLLAQTDSCIGSKNSINFKKSKNSIGNFYPPKKIIVNFNFLKTLKEDEIRSGLGEILKYAIINSKREFVEKKDEYFDLIKNKNKLHKFIIQSLYIKKRIIEKDEFDKNIRRILNYGHTFGHALESDSKFQIPHGIAITIGMDIANFISYKKNFLSKKDYYIFKKILRENYKKYIFYKPNIKNILKYIKNDKKNIKKGYGNFIIFSGSKLKIINIKLNNHFEYILIEFFKSFSLQD